MNAPGTLQLVALFEMVLQLNWVVPVVALADSLAIVRSTVDWKMLIDRWRLLRFLQDYSVLLWLGSAWWFQGHY